MLTFKNLSFFPHPLQKYGNEKMAAINFDNRYGVSVIFGKQFYSNGIDTYEVAVLLDNDICYDTKITSDVLGYLTEDEVTEIMYKIQSL